MDENYGSLDGPDAYVKAQQIISDFNVSCQQQTGEKDTTYAKIGQTETGETVVVVVDPFMRRVHEVIPQSGEVCMVDATSNLGELGKTLVYILNSYIPAKHYNRS